MHHLIRWNEEFNTIQSKYISKFLLILNYELDILFSLSEQLVCICKCISTWIWVLYEGPEEIQLYFHREYEHQGHCLTTHVALNTYWIQIIITVMMGTRYTGGGMRCCTKSKWLVLLGPKVSSSLTWSRALLMTQQVNIVVIEIISFTFDTNSLILMYA